MARRSRSRSRSPPSNYRNESSRNSTRYVGREDGRRGIDDTKGDRERRSGRHEDGSRWDRDRERERDRDRDRDNRDDDRRQEYGRRGYRERSEERHRRREPDRDKDRDRDRERDRSSAHAPARSSRRSASPPSRTPGSQRRSGSPAADKAKPNFAPSGLLARATNTVKASDGTSTVLKYNEPPEARKPTMGWRLYVFKGSEQVGEFRSLMSPSF
jgi:smad nuclear-interacting protein 1